MIIHKQYGEPLDPSQGPKGTKWILIMCAAKRLYAGKVTFLLLQGLWTCISAETISYVSFCYIKFSTTKSICTTWFIHPEIERCISAFQLFSRRQYHSCWKIYSRTWSCQVFLSNHTTLNVRIRLQYFTFYEFLRCYCLSLFWWCPRSSLDVLEWMNYSLCMVSNSFFSVVSVLETADNWSTCLRVIMHRIGYSLAHNDSKCQMIYEASILTLFVSDLKICSWRIKGKNVTTDRLHKKGVWLLPFGILMIQWELTSKSVGVCIALFLKECIYFSIYMSRALSHA